MKLYYKYGINVNMESLKNCNPPFDQQRYNELVQLKEKYPQLTQSINNELNCYTEQREKYKLFKTETIQEQYIPEFNYSKSFIKHFLKNFTISINMNEDFIITMIDVFGAIANSNFTEKQLKVLTNWIKGFNIGNDHKTLKAVINKIHENINKKGVRRKMDKELIKADEVEFDMYCNQYTRNEYYEEQVQKSKQKMDLIRELSMQINLNPIDYWKEELYKQPSMLKTLSTLQEISKERELDKINLEEKE